MLGRYVGLAKTTLRVAKRKKDPKTPFKAPVDLGVCGWVMVLPEEPNVLGPELVLQGIEMTAEGMM